MLTTARGLRQSRRIGTRLLSASSTEAREALQFVDETERKINEKALDRNRDGTIKLSFAIVGPSEVQTVNELLYATYYPDEPLIKHLGLCTSLNSIKDVDRRVSDRLALNLTLLAYDETGRPVGAAVNNFCVKGEANISLEEELRGVEDPSYRPLQAIHYQLRRENDHIYDEIGIEKMFSIGMIGVAMKGQGVATNLIRRSILLAGCLGFRGIKTEATGKFSREAYERVGLQASGNIKYADYTFEGKKVFAGMEGVDTEITFMKKKFFQSSLKHIL
jgi:hypothetical protein